MSNPSTGSCTHSDLLFRPIEVHNHKFVHIPGSQYKLPSTKTPSISLWHTWGLTVVRKLPKVTHSVTRTFDPPKYANLKHGDPWKGMQRETHVNNLSRTHLQCQTGLEVLKVTDRQDCIKQIYKSATTRMQRQPKHLEIQFQMTSKDD
jgi:hypothetical protein